MPRLYVDLVGLIVWGGGANALVLLYSTSSNISSSTLLLARPSATNTTTRIDDLMICFARHRTLIRLTSKIVKNVENVFNT